MSWLRRVFGEQSVSHLASTDSGLQASVAELQARCHELEDRLRQSDDKVRERSALLYDLQRNYSAEHFSFQESTRNLKIERMRNAGMFADRDILISRAKQLQQRIAGLKKRLRNYESVEDEVFDLEPIVRENA